MWIVKSCFRKDRLKTVVSVFVMLFFTVVNVAYAYEGNTLDNSRDIFDVFPDSYVLSGYSSFVDNNANTVMLTVDNPLIIDLDNDYTVTGTNINYVNNNNGDPRTDKNVTFWFYKDDELKTTKAGIGDVTKAGINKIKVSANQDILISEIEIYVSTDQLDKPIVNYQVDNKQVRLTWQAVDHASGYEIYRNDVLLDTVVVNTYTDSSVNYDSDYVYKVKAVSDDVNYMSNISDNVSVHIDLIKTDIEKPVLSYSNDKNTVHLNWQLIMNASSYEVYRNSVLIDTVTSTSYDDTVEFLNDYDYQVKVLPVSNLYNSSLSEILSVNIEPDKSQLEKPILLYEIDTRNKLVKLSWGEILNASSYEIYKNGELIKTVETYTYNDLVKYDESNVYKVKAIGIDQYHLDSVSNEVTACIYSPAEYVVSAFGNKNEIVVQVYGGYPPYDIYIDDVKIDNVSVNRYVVTGLNQDQEYTVKVIDDDGAVYEEVINTGSQKILIPPKLPKVTDVVNTQLGAFSTAGTIAIQLIMASVTLGSVVILGKFGWQMVKKWLAKSK